MILPALDARRIRRRETADDRARAAVAASTRSTPSRHATTNASSSPSSGSRPAARRNRKSRSRSCAWPMRSRQAMLSRAFLVLGGDGWKLRDYFTSGKLSEHLIHAALVRVVTLEAFIRLATTGSSDRSGLHSALSSPDARTARRFTPSAVGVRLRLAPAKKRPSRHLHGLRATSGRPGSLSRVTGSSGCEGAAITADEKNGYRQHDSEDQPERQR